MKVIHYQEFTHIGAPICGRAPYYAEVTLRKDQVSCKWCLRKLATSLSPTKPSGSQT